MATDVPYRLRATTTERDHLPSAPALAGELPPRDNNPHTPFRLGFTDLAPIWRRKKNPLYFKHLHNSTRGPVGGTKVDRLTCARGVLAVVGADLPIMRRLRSRWRMRLVWSIGGVAVALWLAGCGVASSTSWLVGDDAGPATGPDGTATPDPPRPPLDLAGNDQRDAGGPAAICGDGVFGPGEECDDGNVVSSDGCTGGCLLETGWACTAPGTRCIARQCGDGIMAGNEQCDDGNATPDDGCSTTCKREPGFICATQANKSVCQATHCGDGALEGFEQCDDGNRVPYDGCSPDCAVEPHCANGTCTAICGDGLKFAQEECDDGNPYSGDGCDEHCTLESGFACELLTEPPTDALTIPILYRDFLARDTSPCGTSACPGHPDFEHNLAGGSELVMATLGSDGKPQFASSWAFGAPHDDASVAIVNAQSLCWWYHDRCGGNDNPYAKPVVLDAAGHPTMLTLARLPSGAYQFDTPHFFPLDDLGWVDGSGHSWQTAQADDGRLHNFFFTSELRYQFTYRGGEVLDFTGDDDVFVFINGRLAVDLGGVHEAKSGSITLDAASASLLGLTVGGMYEIALFQAERHSYASNYRLTLTGFVRARTLCQSICGDGIVTPDEVCDDGADNGGYGRCLPGCQGRGPFCGDGIVEDAEPCDRGIANAPAASAYGPDKCTTSCEWAPYCGDGQTQNDFAEECDGEDYCDQQCQCKTIIP